MAKIGVILSENRLVMLEDLVTCTGKLIRGLKYDKGVLSVKRPHKCSVCSSKEIVGVEVMGGYNGILFWECDICEYAILRFEEDLTEQYLQLAKGVWTNPDDWGYVPRSEFN